MRALAALLVAIISLATQLGPNLFSHAINHGFTPPHYNDFAVVVAASALPATWSPWSSRPAHSGQGRVTGRRPRAS